MIRLQVFLSRNGVCSRRKAMELIQQGQVAVNGKVIREPSFAIEETRDAVAVDGRPIDVHAFQYVLLNKPAGVVTTKTSQFGQRTVLDLLPRSLQHLHPVGRLDKDTEGLLLLTNDGNLTNQLTHPSFDVDKTYFVRAHGALPSAVKSRLESGVMLEGKKTAPARIEDVRLKGEQTEFLMTIHEGRKRQIRLMLDSVGCPVVYLQRLRQGPLSLGSLKAGSWRYLDAQEITKLRRIGKTSGEK